MPTLNRVWLQRNRVVAGLLAFVLLFGGFWWAHQAAGGFRGLRKVGFIAPFSGVSSRVGYALLPAVKLALAEANTSGGVQGYRLELIALDDAATPLQTAEDVRELARDPDVLGIIGAFDSNTSTAAAAAAASAGIALIDALAPSGSQAQYGALSLAPSAVAQAKAISSFVATHKLHPIALLHDSTSNAAWLVPLQVRLAAEYGSLVSITPLNFTSGDPHPLLEQILKAKPHALVYDGPPATAALLAQYLLASGSSSFLIGGADLDTPVYAQLAGRAAPGTLYETSAPDPPASAAEKGFVAAYLAQGGVVPVRRGGAVYDATRLLLEGARRSHISSRETTRKAIEKVLANIQNYPGVLGALSFTDNQRTNSPPATLYQVGAQGYPGQPVTEGR